MFWGQLTGFLFCLRLILSCSYRSISLLLWDRYWWALLLLQHYWVWRQYTALTKSLYLIEYRMYINVLNRQICCYSGIIVPPVGCLVSLHFTLCLIVSQHALPLSEFGYCFVIWVDAVNWHITEVNCVSLHLYYTTNSNRCGFFHLKARVLGTWKRGGNQTRWPGVGWSQQQRSILSSQPRSAVGTWLFLQPTVERNCSRLSKRREERRDRLGQCEHILTTLTPTGDRRKLQVRGKQEVPSEVDVR